MEIGVSGSRVVTINHEKQLLWGEGGGGGAIELRPVATRAPSGLQYPSKMTIAEETFIRSFTCEIESKRKNPKNERESHAKVRQSAHSSRDVDCESPLAVMSLTMPRKCIAIPVQQLLKKPPFLLLEEFEFDDSSNCRNVTG